MVNQHGQKKMKFEFGIIIIMSFLILGILALVVSDPNEAPYWESLNDIEIIRGAYSDDSDIFAKTQQKDDATCYTTPNGNLFCYEAPRMQDDFGVSYVRGENKIEGELHFDPIKKGVTYFTIKNMTKIDDDTARIIFADRNYSFGNIDGTIYSIDEKFEYSTIIKKFDAFISHCQNYQGTAVQIVQYIGISTIDGIDYFMTWHTPANLPQGIQCDYPEIIQHSLEHNFGEL